MTFFSESSSKSTFLLRIGLLTALLGSVFYPSPVAIAQQHELGLVSRSESGGTLHPYQAAYDVQRYVLDLVVDPSDSTLAGFAETHARIVSPTDTWRLALDPRFEISTIEELMHNKNPKPGEGMHLNDAAGNRILEQREWTRPAEESKYIDIEFPRTLEVGERVAIRIHYSGAPRVARRAPWDGGFVWAKTPSGAPWVGVACQTDGAWIWWPNKDHPSDEPDRGATLRFTMPSDLKAVSNGVLTSEEVLDNGFTKWTWSVKNPINSYTVTLNAAPYLEMSEEYVSVAGDTMPIQFWVLPEFEEKGKWLFPQFAEHLRFFEEVVGPYPFRNEKYGVAHAPFLGMEHQTLIAYGASFSNDNMFGQGVGFDDLHHHELAHEWWGNLVTAWDWRDFWIHEGFGTYMQALFAEQLEGRDGYNRVMGLTRMRIVSQQEIVPQGFQTTRDVYGTGRGGDIYYKGAWVLHTLRGIMGDELFFQLLSEFAYPTPESREKTDGTQLRFVSSRDFKEHAERVSGLDLEAFFDLYLHTANLPDLKWERDGRSLRVWFENIPEGVDFRVPVEIESGGKILRPVVSAEPVEVQLHRREDPSLDPRNLILKAQVFND